MFIFALKLNENHPMPKQNVKNVVLPHSEAKLELYRGYLLKYVQILVVSQRFNSINIYDVFCGSGIYEDGRAGSPVLAFETIKENRIWTNNNKIENPTPIKLSINDIEKNKVENVKQHFQNQVQPINVTVEYNNLLAKEFMSKIVQEVNLDGRGVRNLVFIDPYGYKDIEAATILDLLKGRNTEVILFLPVSFIYRFSSIAQIRDDVVQYDHLRSFIASFFPTNHPIRKNEPLLSPLDFIKNLKEAMTFDGKFHSASYFIQRDKGNYFALFFMTSNLLGLEKFLKTKWELDPIKGEGFKMPNQSPGLFDDFFNKEDKDGRIVDFGKALEAFLKSGLRNDSSVYEFTLANEFLPEHTNSIFKEWQKAGIIEVLEKENDALARKGSFNINYESTKNNSAGSKFIFKFK